MANAKNTIVAAGSIAASIIAAFVLVLVLGRYSRLSVFAKSTWVDGNWNPVTKYNIGDEKYLATQIPSWLSPKTIQTVHIESGVSTRGTVHDWPASTGTTYRTDGGIAETASSFSDCAIVTGSVFGIPVTFWSNNASVTVG